jgi:hypothetical protein
MDLGLLVALEAWCGFPLRKAGAALGVRLDDTRLCSVLFSAFHTSAISMRSQAAALRHALPSLSLYRSWWPCGGTGSIRRRVCLFFSARRRLSYGILLRMRHLPQRRERYTHGAWRDARKMRILRQAFFPARVPPHHCG